MNWLAYQLMTRGKEPEDNTLFFVTENGNMFYNRADVGLNVSYIWAKRHGDKWKYAEVKLEMAKQRPILIDWEDVLQNITTYFSDFVE